MLSKKELNAFKPCDLMVFEVLREDQGFLREGEPQPKPEYHVSLFVGKVQRNDFVDFDLQPIYNGKMHHEKYFLREDKVYWNCAGILDGFLSEQNKLSMMKKTPYERANSFNELVKNIPYLQSVLSNPKDSIICPSKIEEIFMEAADDDSCNTAYESNRP